MPSCPRLTHPKAGMLSPAPLTPSEALPQRLSSGQVKHTARYSGTTMRMPAVTPATISSVTPGPVSPTTTMIPESVSLATSR